LLRAAAAISANAIAREEAVVYQGDQETLRFIRRDAPEASALAWRQREPGHLDVFLTDAPLELPWGAKGGMSRTRRAIDCESCHRMFLLSSGL
jgi:hypothetical protein